MALISGIGTSSVVLGTTGTKRDDISEFLAANLVMANNVAGALRVGPEFADTIVQWDEDKLNSDTITDTQSGGLTSVGTQLVVSQSDGSITPVGTVLFDTSTALGGPGGGELLMVTGVQAGTPTNLQVSRGFGGTTPVGHAQGATYTHIARALQENSDLGPDMSRARIRKFNYLQRHGIDVVLSAEVIERSRRGYTPGIQDELVYQFANRTQEILKLWNRSTIYGAPFAGSTGTTSLSGGDYSTMCGIRKWLDTTFNSTSVVTNWATAGYPVGAIDVAINTANITLFRNGAVADWCVVGPQGAVDVGRLYNDRIRLQQDEQTRGFAAQYFRSTLANEFRLLLDGYVSDSTGIGDIFLVDSSRARLRPFAGQGYYTITAETLRDGDQVRGISKMSLEFRNTGTDAGQASMAIINASL